MRRMPEIVPIVLREAARLLNLGQLTPVHFDQKLARLAAEELTPRGLELLVRNLANGTMRFLIRDFGTASVLEMIDCEKRSRAVAVGLPGNGGDL